MTTLPNIPDAAVEAAARVIHSQHEQSPLEDWSEDFQLAARRDARAALEAAAPHLMAEAWEQGADAEFGRAVLNRARQANPYRAAEAGE